MVDIIWGQSAIVDLDHVTNQADDIQLGYCAMFNRNFTLEIQLLVKFITANFFQIVMARIEQLLNDVIASIIQGRWFTWAQFLVKLNQRCLGNCQTTAQIILRFFFERRFDKGMIRVIINILKKR